MTMRGVAHAASLAAIAAYFLVSANVLTAIGSRYQSEGGSLLEKIHPATYLAVFGCLLRAASSSHGLAGLRRILWRHGKIAVFLAGMTVCMGTALAFTGTGALIALIDTFLPAGALALALTDADDAALLHLRRLLQCLFVLNATLAVVEATLQLHIFPVPPDPSFAGTEFRPVGLADHPLTGATATMLGWMLRPDAARAPLVNLAYQGLMIAALSAFAERAPLALGLCGAIAVASARMPRRIVGRQIHSRDAVAFAAAPLAIAALLGVAIISGIGQRLGAHLYWDDSASVRLSAFNILFMLSMPEWIFGTRREDLIAMIEPMRLTYHVGVIENFWLVMLVTLGAIGFPVFVASLASLLAWLWQQADRTGRAMVITLVIASSCSNSLGRKSMLLALLVACVLAAKAKPARRRLPEGRGALEHPA